MIRRQLDKWQTDVSVRDVSALFIRITNLAGFVLILWMVPIADAVWGVSSFAITYSDITGFGTLATLLRFESIRSYYWIFIVLFLCSTAIGALGFSRWYTRFLTWFLFLNLFFGNYDVSNGGWHLLIQLYLLSIFLLDKRELKVGWQLSLGNLLHNIAFRFIWVQIVLMYLTSGIHKLFGMYWINGEALLITLSVPEYSIPIVFENLTSNSWLLMAGNWSALLYQLLFPILIWFSGIRPLVVWCGIIFHVSIIIVLGITDFGLILIAVYSIFLSKTKAKGILQRVSFN